ncbi:MAG: radical SAM protein [Deltaproteobacteria bacterium]|nr:radical SAM protein [Deltaproteobacteria bacterium]
MDVLLVNPRFNGASEVSPLSLECLAAPLLADGLTVSIVDMDIGPEEEAHALLIGALKGGKPLIMGVTTLSGSIAATLSACRTAKKIHPPIRTVLGGIHATVLHEEILREYEEVDVVVRGEGEEALRELMRSNFAMPSLEKISGISYRRDHRIVCNPDRPLLKDLGDMPPPAFQLLDNSCYRTRSLSSSRGCYHNCRFCSIQSLYQGIVRQEALAKILTEIRALRSAGAKRIMFTDDNFTFHPRRVREICGMMIQEGLAQGAEFYVQGRIDDFCRQPVMAQWLSEAGFKAVYVGAESGAQEILDRYGKGMATEDLKRGVSYCIEQNLMPVVSFILFGPWDTVETMLKTIRLAKELFENGAEIAYTECLIPFPGTPVQEELEKDGKWRESGGVYYFESYTGMAMDWVLKVCDLARAMARLIYGDDPLFSVRRVYYEFSLLEFFIQGQAPPAYGSWIALLPIAGRDDAMETKRRQIESAMRDILSIS